jgi:D-alanyl-lipoteichoic acid acyltransferase DltB (MBOAT superfamily)
VGVARLPARRPRLLQVRRLLRRLGARALSTIGFDVGDPVLAIVLPLGISFYTVHGDGLRRRRQPRRMAAGDSLVDYALFVAYFPAPRGRPILRAPALMPQFAAPRTIGREDLAPGPG